MSDEFARSLAQGIADSDSRGVLKRTVAMSEQFAMEENNRLDEVVVATQEFAGKYSQDERKQGAKEGWALPDGSFPIKNRGDVQDAIGLVGNYKGKYDAKAHVIKRAKAVGATNVIPDSWLGSKDTD